MFKVTILKMKDILKYLIGICLTGLVIVFFSRGFEENNENDTNNSLTQIIGKKIDILTQNSMLQALDISIPAVSNINEEYKNVAKEDDENKETNILYTILGTQISAINVMENIESNQPKEEKNLTEEKNANNETNENKDVVLEGVKTEVITPNPISDGANTQIRKCKDKKSNRLSNNSRYV